MQNTPEKPMFTDQVPLTKPTGRCCAPGHKKMQRRAQQIELGLQPGCGAPRSLLPLVGASSATAFTLAGNVLPQEIMDMFREVNPDVEARVLERWTRHNHEMKRQQARAPEVD